MDKAINGSRAAGIYPFQPGKFTEEDFAPAAHYAIAVEDNENNTLQEEGEDKMTERNQDHDITAMETQPSTSTSLPSIHASNNLASEKLSKNFNIDSITSLSPIPTPSNKKEKARLNQRKHISKIFTETPNKDELEDAEYKKKKRKETVDQRVKQNRKKTTKTVKTDLFESSDSEEVDESQLCNDELDDISAEKEDLCLICGGRAIKNEVWYRCTMCSGRAHALCSGYDTPENYLCDFCGH